MKDVTLWKCDICGTEYRDKKKCEQCEAGHKKKGKIVNGEREIPVRSLVTSAKRELSKK